MKNSRIRLFSLFIFCSLFFFPASPGEAKRLPNPNYPLPMQVNHSDSESFPTETERKFLLHSDSLSQIDLSKAKSYQIIQTYLSYEPEIRIRRINNQWHTFTLKTPQDSIGLSRSELEFPISKGVYEDLVKKQVGQTIYKTRYQFHDGNYDISIDVYKDSLQGLIVAEIEFDSIEDANHFKPLSWFGKEVTSDLRYKNAGLAKNGKPEAPAILPQ